MNSRRATRDNAALVVIDVQERLLPVIHQNDEIIHRMTQLIRGCAVLNIPMVVTEQYVKGLGATVAPLKEALEQSGGYNPIEKMCFSSYGCSGFVQRLRELGRKQVILCGIESHVCVYQTTLDLLDAGFEVYLVVDAVSSRREEDKAIAIERLAREGARLVTTEMILFELTVTSGTDEFKAISKLVK